MVAQLDLSDSSLLTREDADNLLEHFAREFGDELPYLGRLTATDVPLTSKQIAVIGILHHLKIEEMITATPSRPVIHDRCEDPTLIKMQRAFRNADWNLVAAARGCSPEVAKRSVLAATFYSYLEHD